MPHEYARGTWQEVRSFSPAVASAPGRTIWLAGEVGLALEDADFDRETAGLGGLRFAEGFDAQVHSLFRRLRRTLERFGGRLEDIVTMTVFLTDPGQGRRFVEIRSEYFPPGQYPASALICAGSFPVPEILVEVQAVAVLPAAGQPR